VDARSPAFLLFENRDLIFIERQLYYTIFELQDELLMKDLKNAYESDKH